MAKLKMVLTAEEHEALADEATATKALYVAGDSGKFYLDAEEVDAHPTIRGLKATLEKFKKFGANPEAVERKIKGLTDRLEAFGELDAEDVAAKLARLEELEKGGGGGDVAQRVKDAQEAVRASLTKTHEKTVTDLTTENARLLRVLDRLVVQASLDSALSAADENGQPLVIPGLRSGARAVLMGRTPKVVWDGDEPSGVFTNDTGEEVPIGTYVGAWLRTDEARWYQPPSGNDGSDSASGKRPRGAIPNPWKTETFNLTEQGKIVKSNPGLAKQLAAAAGKTLDL